MAKKKTNATDALTFTKSSDSPRGAGDKVEERDLAAELYKKNWGAQKIDAYEKQVLGLPSPAAAKPKLRYASRMFTPEYVEDSKRFDDLMNNPKYGIIYFKDNWTIEGKYTIFVVYSENLNYKSPDDINDSTLTT
jgi:hypothetical protein